MLEKLPFYIEDFLRNLLAKVYNYRVFSISKPNLEVDVALGSFNEIKLVGEIKWRKNISYKQIKEIERKLEKFKDAKKVLIVINKEELDYYPENIEVLDAKDIVSLVTSKQRNPT